MPQSEGGTAFDEFFNSYSVYCLLTLILVLCRPLSSVDERNGVCVCQTMMHIIIVSSCNFDRLQNGFTSLTFLLSCYLACHC